MSRHLPPLNAIRVFEAAARHQSFVRAAEELHVSPAAVSQQIKLLEDYLGVVLFKRGKKLALGESSVAVLPLVTDAFDQLERAMAKVRVDSIAGPLVVSAPPAFAARWLVPRMDDFHACHPAVELHLLATRRLVDFSVEDVDVAIRLGTGDYPELYVEHLMPEKIVLVATPGLAQSIKAPADLAGCSLLEDDWHVKNDVFPAWEIWFSSSGGGNAPLRIKHFSDLNLTIQAALAGLGVAMAWYSLVEDDLKMGRLVQLLDRTIPTNRGFHLVMPKNRATLGKVVAFKAWLVDQAVKQISG